MLMFYSRRVPKLSFLGHSVCCLSFACSVLLLQGCQVQGQIQAADISKAPDSVESDTYKGSVNAQFIAASTALAAGNNEKAKALLLNLTSDAPELSSPWVNLGIAYRNLGVDDKAVKAFEQALFSQPKNCNALNQLGIMARESGDFELAEARYFACLEFMPEFREVHLNLGILYELYMGKYAAALSEYRNYMAGLDEPDRRVGGWIKDLERRQSSMLATENY